ncbi:hypothetical protein AMATHDRAFT_76807 [Amanita thiersii Skay4041]|uniref:Adenosine deaminase domain-containing protein n=1 Tax=Amanita thiersii Skay4041 TaxID=703135 RepID=A0A2A9NKQ0_9AGAR|nr:hypothetical protein AMATHDRAFT_76807 [Amanita thiersii Skay4041]
MDKEGVDPALMHTIAGPAAAALECLSSAQIEFIQSLPKAELHAHLNGSIPIEILQHLARDYLASDHNSVSGDEIKSAIQTLLHGPSLEEIHDFFTLFPAIYALTSTRSALAYATRAVLADFLDGERPQCAYLELRTTPREMKEMTREEYLRAVLEEVERYPSERAALIVSLDRRMNAEIMGQCVDVAVKLRREGRRVVGVDLCGDPTAGDVNSFAEAFERARSAGLRITLHIAETIHNSEAETLKLLSFKPTRLGHATFLNTDSKRIVHEHRICIEICLSSNLLCRTVSMLDEHHIRYYIHHGHPVAICTDDTLPFRTSLLGEYALLMAPAPKGLGLTEEEVKIIAEMSMAARFSIQETN